MNVMGLPHHGPRVQIDINGVQTIFGYSAKSQVVRPSTQPDGSGWEDDKGWELGNGSVVATIADMIRANRQALAGNANNRRFRLEVSPEIAAALRAGSIYEVNNLMIYSSYAAGPVKGPLDEYVNIPLIGDEDVRDRDNESNGSKWHRRGYVDYIQVSPSFEGAKLVELPM
jgi:hypothetical protein